MHQGRITACFAQRQRARRVDLHALRDMFGTHLVASGATPFVLKELMRHSTVQQSEKYYIDARQMPFAAALAALPKFGEKPLINLHEPQTHVG